MAFVFECSLDKCHLERSIVKEKHGKLPLKFGQNRMSKSWDIANIDFPVMVLVVVGGWVVV